MKQILIKLPDDLGHVLVTQFTDGPTEVEYRLHTSDLWRRIEDHGGGFLALSGDHPFTTKENDT